MICPRSVLPRAPPTSSESPPWPRQSSAATQNPSPTHASLSIQSPLLLLYPWNCSTAGCGPVAVGRRYFAWTRAPPTPVNQRSKQSAVRESSARLGRSSTAASTACKSRSASSQ